MIETLSETNPKARKDHYCMACEWLLNEGEWYRFSFAEKRKIVKAKRNQWKIKKGETYINQRNIFDGSIYTYKAITAIHDICIKHDIFADC